MLAQRPSLAAQAAQLLREAIQRGEWSEELPGERRLCERLGISRPTLRAALEQLRREGWLTVARGRPTRLLQPPPAPTGPPPRRPVVVMLSPVPLRAMPPFVMYWVDELRERLAGAGCGLELHVSRALYAARPARALEKVARHGSAAAWLLYLSTDAMQRWFHERGLPCLVAGSCAPAVKMPSVDLDHRAVCRHATGVLFAGGCEHPALVLPAGGYAGDRESEQGFREAWRLRAGPAREPRVIRHDGTVPGLCAELDKALSRAPRADGFLVARTAHALTTLTHLARRGLRVPQEVAVISRDDDAFLEFAVPRLTRYAGDPAQFARRLTRTALLLAQHGVAPARPVRLMPRYLAGETV